MAKRFDSALVAVREYHAPLKVKNAMAVVLGISFLDFNLQSGSVVSRQLLLLATFLSGLFGIRILKVLGRGFGKSCVSNVARTSKNAFIAKLSPASGSKVFP